VAALLIVAKLTATIATDSLAMLSALLDSSVDLVASLVILYSVNHALRPADRSHRYGHGKAEPLAALAQAAFMGGSAVFLVAQACQRIADPRPVNDARLGVFVIIGAIILTTALLAFQRHVYRHTASVAIDADRAHYRADLLLHISILVSLLLGSMTGSPYWDPVFAIGIAGILGHSGWRITRTSLDMLMDRELPSVERARIESIVLAHPAARGMHDLRTRSSGTQLFIELHLELDSTLTLAEAHDITDAIEASLCEAFPMAEPLIHQEPAGLKDERLDNRIAISGILRRG
jgi:ferrous-iron efflux pump FieF